jgi:short subunit dehydrogenase-like uncharacterized protein
VPVELANGTPGHAAASQLISRLSRLAAGVMLLPGAGFDVVPSDCLAAHLNRRLANSPLRQ